MLTSVSNHTDGGVYSRAVLKLIRLCFLRRHSSVDFVFGVPSYHPLLLTQTPQGTVGDGRGGTCEDGRLPVVGPFTPATLLEHLLWAVGLWTNWI